MNKLLDVLSSSNFKISIISLILLALGYNNINTGMTAEGWYSMFDGKNGTELLSTIMVLGFNTISKIYVSIKERGFDWGFIKNSNFISTCVVVLTLLISAIADQYVTGIIVSAITLAVNVFYQLNLPVKQIKP